MVQRQRSHYRLIQRLAAGDTTEVYLARSIRIEGFEKDVVVKRLRPFHSREPEVAGRFLEHARRAASIDHPNVAQIYDVGRDVDAYYVAMEYVAGRDLRSLRARAAERAAAISVDAVVAIAIGVGAGLQAAHDKGVAHRDVRPANVIVTWDGNVKLVDFGAAGGEADRRGDIVSLGILLWQLLDGRDRYGEQTPAELSAIAGRALARPSDGGYRTAAEMLIDLHMVAQAERLTIASYRLAAFLAGLFPEGDEPPERAASPPLFLDAGELLAEVADVTANQRPGTADRLERAPTVVFGGEHDVDIVFDDDLLEAML